MIRTEISIESPVPFVAIAIGEHIKLIENPSLTAYMPFWLQQIMQNGALALAVPTPPRKTPMKPMAAVIPIETLRQNREVRCASSSDVSR